MIKSGDWKIFFVFNGKIVFSFDNILVLHFFIFPLILGKSFVLGKSRIWENLLVTKNKNVSFANSLTVEIKNSNKPSIELLGNSTLKSAHV